jgi:hypothetical protein
MHIEVNGIRVNYRIDGAGERAAAAIEREGYLGVTAAFLGLDLEERLARSARICCVISD